ncbi:nitroreductase [Longilinea arvoryzae]|uniref:Nitroreductase n=1 Tax=Longilinea arvoryzae TaxID=360412 RepID=A0A0S7BGA7_9CHLR|nr:nitroreductase family protein [Longilinea arvoryzae]GAP12474.1 nitroreductase [Longilinea arvoryzae]
MNSTLELLNNRRSLRAYSDQPITAGEKAAILQGAFRAPTAGAMQLYTILEVADPAIKERLAETCDHQPFIAKAPLVLLFLADYQRWWDVFNFSGAPERARELGRPTRPLQVGDLMLACCDTLIAAQSAVIAAESLGIGSCYIGDILENYEIHRELFDLPPYVIPLTLVCFGHPVSQRPAANPSPRFPAEYMVHTDRYRRLAAEEVEPLFRPWIERMQASGGKFVEGAENYGQSNYLRKFIAEFSFEMSRSAAAMLKNWE